MDFTFMDSRTQLGITIPHLIAGFAGGVLSLAFMTKLSLRSGMISVFGGMACAIYLTPVVMHWLGWADRTELTNATAFIVGFLGMNILAFILAVFRQAKSDPRAVLAQLVRRDPDNGGGNAS